MSTTNESIWNDIRRRGIGTDIKKEDNVNNMGIDDFVDYLVANYRDKVYSMDKDHFCKEYEMDIVVDPIKDIVIYGSYVNDELSRIMVVLRNRGQIRLDDWIGKIIENSPDNFRWICMYSDKYELKLKEGDVTNQTYVDLIEFFLNNITLFESVWGDIRRQGNGSDIKKEDNVNLLDVDGLYEYVKTHYTGKVFYIDKDNFGSKLEKVCVDPVKNVSLYTKYDNNNGELDHILISWISVHLDKDFIWKIYDRFQVEKTNPYRLCVWNQDGTCTNQTYIDLIDLFVENKDNVIVNESVWNDIRKRGNGSEIKKEDEIPQELQKPLAIYIEMFASNAFKGDYTVGSYPDFRAFVKDFMNSPRIESLDFDMGDLLDYITQDHYYDVIHPVIMDTIQKINNEIDVAVDNIIDNLKDSNVNESVWNDIRRRGAGDSVKQEEFTEEFIDKVKSDLICFTMSVVNYIKNYELTFDGFYKYLEEIENPDEVKKIIYYVKTHKDECDKLLEKDIKFENKLLDEKVNVYLLRFVDNIVYDEKYHNTLSDIKKFASEIFKGHKSSYDFHINKRLVFKDKSVLFNDYVEDKWKDGSLKQKIDDLIKNENDEISKYGFVKEPGKTISETVNDWWDSLDDSKRDELAWDEFGEDAEEEYYSDHNPKYNEYAGEDFEADEWWDDAYGIRKVKIYCSEHSKTNESVWGDIRKRGLGEEIKKEDEITEDELKQIDQYISDYGNEVVLGWGRGSDACNLDEFIDYLKTDRKVNDRILKYVKDNWFGEICDGVDASIEQTQEELNQDMNESVWGDIRKQGLGDTSKKEDDPFADRDIDSLSKYEFCDYLNFHYEPLMGRSIHTNESTREVTIPIYIYQGYAHMYATFNDNTKLVEISLPLAPKNPPRLYNRMCKKFNVIRSSRSHWSHIEPIDGGELTNTFCLEVIDFILENVNNPLLKKIVLHKVEKLKESVWGDIRKQGLGVENKVEDDVLTDQEINSLNQFTLMYCRGERAHYIQNHIVPPPPSGRKENDYEGLIKYIEDRRDENLFTHVGDYDKIIRFIKKNWDKLDMDKYIKKYIFSPDMMKDKKIVECEGVPGGLTPADVGGMGAAYFPGPNGEPGSGDLPSPTGIVYHQVAPYTVFLKELKKKKKKKKFRIEDEPCAHSKNSKVYDYVDDFREYVDRTYNNIDRK